ncbi:MAG: ABC transporter permease [Oscillospiraceae bacterium]|jgi:spermidine/putrescine transport system permease protein|nr:ABC transporter permease [Oscillospiraceae bacterium]
MTKNRLPGRLYTALIMLFLYAPIFVLIVFSFNATKSRTVWAGFSLKWYTALLRDKQILGAFYTTLAVSLISAAVSTVIGTFAAIGLFDMKRKLRSPVLFVNNIPLVNADIITGVAMCMLFVALGTFLKFKLGFGTLLIAHVTFNIPYIILSVMPKLRQLDGNLLDAGRDLGCTWFGTLWRVIFPEIMPGIINGALIAFTMSIDDFVISYFTAGSDVETLSMSVYSMTRKRISPEVNALSTLLFVTVLILLLAINIRSRGQNKSPETR